MIAGTKLSYAIDGAWNRTAVMTTLAIGRSVRGGCKCKSHANVSPSWHIMSYPRSGNHLARAILEGYSHRPTIGCPGVTKRDGPIYLRKPNLRDGAIMVDDQRPIGFKSHFVREFHTHDRALGGQAGLLLITRDPLKAISSHVYRDVSCGTFTRDRTIRKRVSASIDSYLSLIHIYRSMADRPRLHVCFEALTNPETRVATAQKLLTGMGVDAKVSLTELDAICDAAKASQTSIGKVRGRLMDRIRATVREGIAYDEVLTLID